VGFYRRWLGWAVGGRRLGLRGGFGECRGWLEGVWKQAEMSQLLLKYKEQLFLHIIVPKNLNKGLRTT